MEIILILVLAINLIAAVSDHQNEEYFAAIYHMLWVIATILILSNIL